MFEFKFVSDLALKDPKFSKIISLFQKLEELSFDKYNVDFKKIDYKVKFDLSSVKTLGCFIVSKKDKKSIRLNEYLFLNSSFKDFKEIVIHEFAHMLTYIVFGRQQDAHGGKWIGVMKALNATCISPKTNSFSLVKKKPSDCFVSCNCSEFVISAHRATKIKNGVKYTCRKCSTQLKLKNEV